MRKIKSMDINKALKHCYEPLLVLWLVIATLIDYISQLSLVRLRKNHGVLLNIESFNEDNLDGVIGWLYRNRIITVEEHGREQAYWIELISALLPKVFSCKPVITTTKQLKI